MSFLEFLISNLFVSLVIAVLFACIGKKQNKKQTRCDICDSCEHLCVKNKDTSKWKYICSKCAGGFDIPPEYCCNYTRRDGTGAFAEKEWEWDWIH